MQVKLVDLYNTRYFYVTFRADLVYLFNTCLELRKDRNYVYNIGNEKLGEVYDAVKSGAKVKFDLAGAKISSDVVPKIREYSERGIEFIDTKDKWRDNILRVNRERSSIDLNSTEELPVYDASMSIKDYIVSLDNSKTYRIPLGNRDVYVPLVCLILMSRPSIKIYFNVYDKDIMYYVGSKWTLSSLEKFNEFYLTTPEGIQVVDFSNGPVYVQRLGLCSMEQALTVGTLVPTVFGKQKLVKESVWKDIFRDSLNILNRYRTTRKVKLDEILS